MSGRKLGGGRVLGSGKGLAAPRPSSALQRTVSPYAPSDSTASIGSPETPASVGTASPGPLPGFPQDLTSAISLAPRREPGSSAGGGSKLVCPICEEEMVTLLQLNQHIDDNHQELPEVEQDEVKTWFDKQVLKAKKFQPLSLLNQKLRGLEVFESNESMPNPVVPSTSGPTVVARPPPVSEFDPDDVITHSHWQRQGIHDMCTDPACGKRLGGVNGTINCRKCGRLFCEEHTMYQMKLSRSAAHEPVRGYWYRVCETCYKSREGYNDYGLIRNHTNTFADIRRKKVERQALEISRLEKRLTRLTQLIIHPPEEIATGAGGGNDGENGAGGEAAASLYGTVASLAMPRNQRKAIEQSIVTWEEDAKVQRCPFCQQEFGSWTFRRHHCRLCGRVVCADPQTACSTEVRLNVANPNAPPVLAMEKPATASAENGHLINIDVRMCVDCKTTIFSKRDFDASILYKPPDQRAYETLRQFERGIKLLLPNFQRALIPLQDENNPPTHAQIQEASKLRKRLTDSFTKYDVAARRIRDLKTTSPTQKQLQKAIYAAGSAFLHMHMLPLKNLPRMLKHSSSSSSSSAAKKNRLLANGGNPHHGASVASPLRNGGGGSDLASSSFSETASQASSDHTVTSTAVSSQLDTEEREARERLMVLEEQRFMVQGMIDGARGARRLEEVGALARNAEELDREIEAARSAVRGIEERWRGIYANGAAASGGGGVG